MAVGKRSRPEYYEANRLETGLNHIDNFRASYIHIPAQRWEEIFGPKGSGRDSGEGREQTGSEEKPS